ncbi:hypothetical protein CRE_06481 [Caenorhabditis remanei]|uniref:Uncharacterized protein n=1 Tax=Caenorhabditis remanei TaxID=31234 RepID=E3M1A9_CAERE|nr:hypothetical protein CRE_06481 [Caenorhabditis remanei]
MTQRRVVHKKKSSRAPFSKEHLTGCRAIGIPGCRDDVKLRQPLLTKNKKVVGKFKDELNALIMEKLVALKPKQYGYKIAQETRENFIEYYNRKHQEEMRNPKLPRTQKPGDESKKSKGIKKNVVKNELTVDDFKSFLFGKTIVRKMQYCIRSVKHQIFTQCQNKVVLNNESGDHKRYILKDSHSTMAFGNCHIKSGVLSFLES